MQNLFYYRAGANQFLTLRKMHAPLKIGVIKSQALLRALLKKSCCPATVSKRKLVYSEENRWIYTVQINVFI